MERIVHPLIGTVVTAALIGALVTQSFNKSIHFCWLNTFPSQCGRGGARRDGQVVECVRGKQAYLVFPGLFTSQHCNISVAMVTIYRTVRKMEKRNLRYSTHLTHSSWMHNNISSSTAVHNNISSSTTAAGTLPDQVDNSAAYRLSRQVGFQGIFYVSTLLVSGVPQVIVDLLVAIAGVWNEAVHGTTIFLSSSVGVLYLVVFLRKRPEMRTKYGQCVQSVFSSIGKLLSSCYGVCCGDMRRRSLGNEVVEEQYPSRTGGVLPHARAKSKH